MRAPRERRAARVGSRAAREAAREGGKALLRLRHFEEQRQLDERTTTPRAAAKPPRALRPRAGATRAEPESPYELATEARRELERDASAVGGAQRWRPLGPFSIPHGQTYGAGPGSRPSVSGRLSSVAVDPSDAAHLLVGAGGGGVWESTDGGETWTPRTDDQPSLAVGAIAFDPTDPAKVYAGTGEGDFFSRLGVGLLRSTDGGTTWSVRHRGQFVGSGFFDIAVDPLDGRHLLAALDNGLFESTNGGGAWRRRRNMWTWDLSFHPAVAGESDSTKEVFAACADGLVRSVNGGRTWRKVSLPNGWPGYERLEVCHCPADGDVVYAFGANGQAARLWRRSVFGGPFTRVATPGDLDTTQAWYDWFAATAPNNPDVVYLGAIEVHKGVRGPGGGWRWSTISARGRGPSIHPDQHAIAFSPTDPNVVYVGNDGGLYRSPDAGRRWRALNKGLSVTEFEFLSQHPRLDAFLLGGTQDNGTLRYEGEDAWYHVEDGDGGDNGVDARNPKTCFHTFWGMGMERSRAGGRWGSWQWVGPDTPWEYNALFYPPLEVNGAVVAQAGESVYVSRNSGSRWKNVRLPLEAGTVTALTIPAPSRILAGTDAGHVYRLDFDGRKWNVRRLRRPKEGYVSDLLVDPGDADRVWVTYSDLTGGHVFRSRDGGSSWRNVSAGLPDIPVNTIEVDPVDGDTVWIGADVGVYRTTDAGTSWSAFSAGLPNALVKELLFHRSSRLLRAATQSRGVWEIEADAAASTAVRAYLRDSVVDTGRTTPSRSGLEDPFAPGATTYWWQCTDVKLDAPPYERAGLDAVDFEVFDDDHGVAHAGLQHENAQPGREARIYVQVHNGGTEPATDVRVKVLAAAAAAGLPDLPPGFWTSFPTYSPGPRSPWQPAGPDEVVREIAPGRTAVVGLPWPVPAGARGHQCLLALVSAGNDPLATAERGIAALVAGERRAGLRNVAIVNPPPEAGARTGAVLLNLWASARWARYSIGGDARGANVPKALVLTKRLSTAAKRAGLARVQLSRADKAEVRKAIRGRPELRDRLDLTTGFRPPRKRAWLEDVALHRNRPEPLVVVVNPRARSGRWSLLQSGADGELAGGFTLAVRRAEG